jgi:hypothetical protein
MKSLITTFALLLSTLAVSAQDIVPQAVEPQNSTPNLQSCAVQQTTPRKPIKQHLATPVQTDSLTTIYETVRLLEYGDAATIVEHNLESVAQTIKGYRIVIFMKNAQSARREAVAIQEGFATQFPDIPSYLGYEEPYFRVSVGNFLTPEEAMVYLNRLREAYPKAHIVPENINVKEFAR